MDFKVYVTDHVFQDFDIENEILREAGAKLIVLQCETVGELIAKASDADALLNTFLAPIDGKVMDSMKNLRIIVRYGTGIDTIDVPAATERKIAVANVTDYSIDEVSNHAVALLLALVRNIAVSDRRIRASGDYSLDALKPFLALKGSMASIIGLGKIGKVIARKLSVFGLKLGFYDPFIAQDYEENGVCVKKLTLEEVYDRSHIIILQAPLLNENFHLLNAEAFANMKQKPFIINTARGALIENHAIVQALRSGQISGAALDVVEGMPPARKDDPLLSFDNVIITPHTGWFSAGSVLRLKKGAAMEIARGLRNERPVSLLNPESLRIT